MNMHSFFYAEANRSMRRAHLIPGLISALSLALAFIRPRDTQAQGTVVFNNRIVGTVVTHVYGPQNADPTFYQNGNGFADTVSGAQNWTGFTAIGATGTAGPLGGANFLAQLWAANGADQAEANLQPALPMTTFRTGPAAGFIAGVIATLNNVPQDAPVASVQMRVWDSRGGTITNWAQASADPTLLRGVSPLLNLGPIGGLGHPNPNLYGLQSFNLHLDCNAPLSIIAAPQGQTVKVGSDVGLNVTACGTSPLAYQWQFNGTDLVGATASSYALTNVQTNNTGLFTAVITNLSGSVTSAPAFLDVRPVLVFANGQILSSAQYSFADPVQIQVQSYFTNGLIFYTLDGSAPDFNSIQYTGPFTLAHSARLRVLAYSADFFQRAEASEIVIMVPSQYLLSASTSGGGTLSLNPANGPYQSNTTVNVTATPGSGWTFVGWLGDATGTNPVASLTMNRDKSIQAVFGTTLATTAAGNGSVTLLPPGGFYPYGTVVNLYAVPQPGNYFGIWGNAGSGTNNPLSFTVTSANLTISSLFAVLGAGEFALSVVPDGGGQVSVYPRANRYNSGQSVSLTATPDPGQTFVGWTGDATGAENPLTVMMNQSKSITATFTKPLSLSVDSRAGFHNQEAFQVTVHGDFGAQYQVETTTNFVDWLPSVIVTTPYGTAQFADPSVTNVPMRFYRARLH
jgi:uncharacterized repeat protein (TIGR02543 family)